MLFHSIGNETKIALFTKDLSVHLMNKGYLKGNRVVSNHTTQLEKIVFFLILNTEFKEDYSSSFVEHSHLIDVCPRISKLLLANVITSLDLVEVYCKVSKNLPLEMDEEVMKEFLPCLERLDPPLVLSYVYVICRSVLQRFSSLEMNRKVINISNN